MSLSKPPKEITDKFGQRKFNADVVPELTEKLEGYIGAGFNASKGQETEIFLLTVKRIENIARQNPTLLIVWGNPPIPMGSIKFQRSLFSRLCRIGIACAENAASPEDEPWKVARYIQGVVGLMLSQVKEIRSDVNKNLNNAMNLFFQDEGMDGKTDFKRNALCSTVRDLNRQKMLLNNNQNFLLGEWISLYDAIAEKSKVRVSTQVLDMPTAYRSVIDARKGKIVPQRMSLQ